MRTYMSYKPSGIEWIGEIPQHWKVKKLKYFSTVISGSTPSSSEEKFWDGDIYWVTTDDLGKLLTKEINDSKRKITKEGFDSCGTKLAPKGSIVISSRAPIGHLGKLLIEACTNQGCKTVIFPEKIYSDFYYYFFLSAKEDIQALGKGTTFTELPTQALRDYISLFPNFSEQTAIANFLDHKTAEIDQAMADKKQLITLFEEEKKALINEAVTKGLNPDAKLTPSGIDWLGDIPAHWEVKKLKYISNAIQTGKTPPTSNEEYYLSEDYDWFTPGDFGSNIILENSIRKISQSAVDEEGLRLYAPYTVLLVSIGATLGKIGIVLETCFSNQQINSITFDDNKMLPFFGAYFLDCFSSIIKMQSVASTLSILNQEKTKELLVAVPPLSEQTAIVNHIETETAKINSKIHLVKQEIELLSEYKKALIFEAVTGKIDVQEA